MEIVDDFDRVDLGNAPNGQPYLNADWWMIVPGFGAAPLGADVDPTPLVHDTYRSEGRFTAVTTVSSSMQGIVLRYRGQQSFTYVYRVGLEVGVIRYDDNVPRMIRGWGGVHPDPLPTIPAGEMNMVVQVDGGDYTVTINGVLIGTATDTDPVGQNSTVHGINGQFNLQPGGQPVPRFGTFTMDFDLTDHIRVRSMAPISTRPPLASDHTYIHPGSLEALLYPLPSDPDNAAPVGVMRYPIGLRSTAGDLISLIDEFGNDIVDEEGDILTF